VDELRNFRLYSVVLVDGRPEAADVESIVFEPRADAGGKTPRPFSRDDIWRIVSAGILTC
jgi:hypothetical protein